MSNYQTKYKDTRSLATRKQQALFQKMGTLRRTQVNLENLARPRWEEQVCSITPLQQRILDAAAYVLWDLFKQSQDEMKKLPSKKNLAAKEKSKQSE